MSESTLKFPEAEESMFDHNWHEKVWGHTKCIVRSPYYYRFELKTKKNTFCSYHFHRRRANLFHVESGVVKVVWTHGWNILWKVLTPGQDFVVDSLTPHQFQVLSEGVMYEEYFPDRGGVIFEDDIHRLTIGGESDLVQRNEGLIFNSEGDFWTGGEPNWSTLPLLESTSEPSNNSN